MGKQFFDEKGILKILDQIMKYVYGHYLLWQIFFNLTWFSSHKSEFVFLPALKGLGIVFGWYFPSSTQMVWNSPCPSRRLMDKGLSKRLQFAVFKRLFSIGTFWKKVEEIKLTYELGVNIWKKKCWRSINILEILNLTRKGNGPHLWPVPLRTGPVSNRRNFLHLPF